jgi:hypothetical protein
MDSGSRRRAMQFMITFNHVDGVWERLSAEDREAHGRWLERFTAELSSEKNAKLVFVTPVDQRKAVRKHENGTLDVTDGPAIPGPEQVGGYYIIDAESIEEAVEWAKKGRWLVGANEVRQIFSLPS